MQWLIDRILGRAANDAAQEASAPAEPEPLKADPPPSRIKYHHDPLPPKRPTRDPMQAVCRVICEKPNNGEGGRFGGFGVFVAPDKVLTVWHTINGANNVMFETKDGTVARMRRGGNHKRKTDLDLCLVELDRPIAPHVLPVASERSTRFLVPGETKVRLLTWFDDVAKNVEAKYGMAYQLPDKSWWRDFAVATIVQPGYSGSPFINDQGEVISLVVHGTQLQDYITRGMKDGFTRCGGQTPDKLASAYHRHFVV